VLNPPSLQKPKRKVAANHISLTKIDLYARGKIFLSKEMSGVKLCRSACLLKIADFIAKIWVNDGLTREMLGVFWGVFFGKKISAQHP
jgi:hypothetical protein